MRYLAAAALLGAVATIPIVGGVLFGVFAFGLFLLALVGVIGGLEDRTVRQYGGVRDPSGWRDGCLAGTEPGYEHPQRLARPPSRGRGPLTRS